MLMLISPAKTLDMISPVNRITTSPVFINEASKLINILKKKSVSDIQQLMSISEKLAVQNAERYKQWKKDITEDTRPAMYCFKGDVYQGLQADSFSDENVVFAQKHLRILSGLYGLLNPMDAIHAYRLEMGTRLHTPKREDLYSFWQDKITQLLNQQLQEQQSDIIINLASKEYFNAVNSKKLKAKIISPIFQDEKNGSFKIISFFAKKARGMMAAFIIKNEIKEPYQIKEFNNSGYFFDQQDSNEHHWLFKRFAQS